MEIELKETNIFVEQLRDMNKEARAEFIPVLLEDSATILANIVAKQKPKRVLEIGTAIGYSGTLILKNSPNSILETVEIDNENYNVAKNNFKKYGLEKQVIQYLANAGDFLKTYNGEKFDFIFLDGPKGQYIKYLPYLKKILNENGILFADNVLHRGMVDCDIVPPHKCRSLIVNLRKFLAEIKSDKDFESELLHIGDGVLIVTKKR